MSKWSPLLAVLLVLVILAGPFTIPRLSSASTQFQNQSTMELTSSAFKNGEHIPAKYTCDGADMSPPLSWAQSPTQTKTFVLVLDDPNAAGFTHWVIYNIPATLTGLEENVPRKGNLPNGASQGMNGFDAVGYNGPCPPSGTHNYKFHLYAIDSALTLPVSVTKQSVLAAINGHVLDQVVLTGLYP